MNRRSRFLVVFRESFDAPRFTTSSSTYFSACTRRLRGSCGTIGALGGAITQPSPSRAGSNRAMFDRWPGVHFSKKSVERSTNRESYFVFRKYSPLPSGDHRGTHGGPRSPKPRLRGPHACPFGPQGSERCHVDESDEEGVP